MNCNAHGTKTVFNIKFKTEKHKRLPGIKHNYHTKTKPNKKKNWGN